MSGRYIAPRAQFPMDQVYFIYTRRPCPSLPTYVTLVHRDYYNTHISDMLLKVRKVSGAEGVDMNLSLNV